MAENPGQPKPVPDDEQTADAAQESAASAGDASSSPAETDTDDEPRAELLVDGDSISEEDINALLNAAAGVRSAKADPSAATAVDAEESPSETRPFAYPELNGEPNAAIDPQRVTMLNDVNLRVRLQLGQTRMYLEDVLKLSEGSVVELDKLAGDPVDVLVNDRLIARGEVLVLNDVFCVRICEVLSNDPHRITV